MLTMRLSQKAQTYFRNPHCYQLSNGKQPPMMSKLAAHVQKRAQIRDVLRQYERGSLEETEAVEELLKILR